MDHLFLVAFRHLGLATILCVLFLFQNFKPDRIMGNDLCRALIVNDMSALKQVMNSYLEKLDATAKEKDNVTKIKTWIEGQPCVTSVTVEEQVLASEPPIQRFFVKVRDESGGSISRTIGVRLSPIKLTSDLK
jgi:hypothetical protein